jgi:hypothetical protein
MLLVLRMFMIVVSRTDRSHVAARLTEQLWGSA